MNHMMLDGRISNINREVRHLASDDQCLGAQTRRLYSEEAGTIYKTLEKELPREELIEAAKLPKGASQEELQNSAEYQRLKKIYLSYSVLQNPADDDPKDFTEQEERANAELKKEQERGAGIVAVLEGEEQGRTEASTAAKPRAAAKPSAAAKSSAEAKPSAAAEQPQESLLTDDQKKLRKDIKALQKQLKDRPDDDELQRQAAELKKQIKELNHQVKNDADLIDKPWQKLYWDAAEKQAEEDAEKNRRAAKQRKKGSKRQRRRRRRRRRRRTQSRR